MQDTFTGTGNAFLWLAQQEQLESEQVEVTLQKVWRDVVFRRLVPSGQ